MPAYRGFHAAIFFSVRFLLRLSVAWLVTASWAATSHPGENPASPARAATPCGDLLAALHPSTNADPAPWLAAARCLRQRDSATGNTFADDSLLRSRLPESKAWYLTHLERLRLQGDAEHAADMAYLTERRAPADPDLERELAEVYPILPDLFHAALALLRAADLDTEQTASTASQIDNLLRLSASDAPVSLILDSLARTFRPQHRRPEEILEALCWNHRDYPCAFASATQSMRIRKTESTRADIAHDLDRADRFHSAGYFDYAASILETAGWRTQPPPWRTRMRGLFIQIRYQMQDWPAIAEESGESPWDRHPDVTPPELFAAASAQLKIGNPSAAARIAARVEEGPDGAWAYRAKLLRAQALLALGRSDEAADLLSQMKKDPDRTEATGPILFWQGCLAIEREKYPAAESLFVLASAYTGSEESQRALEYRFFLVADTTGRRFFFPGLQESPRSAQDRLLRLAEVPAASGLWVFAGIEKAQIRLTLHQTDSALAEFERVAGSAGDKQTAMLANAKAAFLKEKLPGGKQAALATYEGLLINYQRGVIPEFSRGRIRALQ